MDFRRSLFLSGFFHLCIMLAGFLVLPSIAPHQTEAIASIPVELISEEAQVAGEKDAQKMETPQRRSVPTPAVRPDEVKPDEKSKPVDPSAAPAPPPLSATAPTQEKLKTPEPVKEKAEELDPQALLKKIQESRKEEKKKQEEDKKKLAEEKKKIEEKRLAQQAEKFDASHISNLLNRQQGAPAPTGQQASEQKQASLGNPKGEGKALTQSQRGLIAEMIRKQLEPCWQLPPGAPPDLLVIINMSMNPDGSLNGRPQIVNNNSHPAFRATADAAVRAVLRCSPLKLPAEMYDVADGWKDIQYKFNDKY